MKYCIWTVIFSEGLKKNMCDSFKDHSMNNNPNKSLH